MWSQSCGRHIRPQYAKRSLLFVASLSQVKVITLTKVETFLKEKDRLLGFIRNRVSNVEEAEDILQAVFYQFIAGYQTVESIDRVTSWLFSVA